MTAPDEGGRARDARAIPWAERSPVPANMLNPGVVAAVLGSAAVGYRRDAGTGMPWTLAFLIAPLVFHRGTRAALPRATNTHLSTWISREPVIRAGVPMRAASLVGPVREGLRFGLRYEILRLDGDQLDGASFGASANEPELTELLSKGAFVGRWMAKLDRPSTAFALFGLTV